MSSNKARTDRAIIPSAGEHLEGGRPTREGGSGGREASPGPPSILERAPSATARGLEKGWGLPNASHAGCKGNPVFGLASAADCSSAIGPETPSTRASDEEGFLDL